MCGNLSSFRSVKVGKGNLNCMSISFLQTSFATPKQLSISKGNGQKKATVMSSIFNKPVKSRKHLNTNKSHCPSFILLHFVGYMAFAINDFVN